MRGCLHKLSLITLCYEALPETEAFLEYLIIIMRVRETTKTTVQDQCRIGICFFGVLSLTK